MTDLIADAYASMSVFRTFLRNAGTSDATDPDSALELLALESAARAIERAAGRRFSVAASAAAARVYGPADGRTLYIDDLADGASITTVKFDLVGNGDFDTTVTGYRVGPANAAARGLPYTKIIFDHGTYPPSTDESVQVTAKWGWTAIPKTIEQANLIQAARFLKRRDAAFGIAGSPELGNEMRLLAKVDPDVAIMIGAFKRNWGAV